MLRDRGISWLTSFLFLSGVLGLCSRFVCGTFWITPYLFLARICVNVNTQNTKTNSRKTTGICNPNRIAVDHSKPIYLLLYHFFCFYCFWRNAVLDGTCIAKPFSRNFGTLCRGWLVECEGWGWWWREQVVCVYKGKSLPQSHGAALPRHQEEENRQNQTSANRTNVWNALRLALFSASEVIPMLKGLKNTRPNYRQN